MINLYDDFSDEELDFQMNQYHRRNQDHNFRRPWIDIEADDHFGMAHGMGGAAHGLGGGLHGPSAAAAMALPLRRRQLPAVPSPPLSLDWVNLSPYGFPGRLLSLI